MEGEGIDCDWDEEFREKMEMLIRFYLNFIWDWVGKIDMF